MSIVNEKIEDAFNKFKVEFNRKGFAYSGTGAEIFKAGYEAAMKEQGDENEKLRFMIKYGLGWEDMKTDGALGEGADR